MVACLFAFLRPMKLDVVELGVCGLDLGAITDWAAALAVERAVAWVPPDKIMDLAAIIACAVAFAINSASCVSVMVGSLLGVRSSENRPVLEI